MAEDSDDKQFDPSAQRLAKAREEGNVFKSQETTAVGMLGVGVTVLIVGTPPAFQSMRQMMETLFLDAAQIDFNLYTLPLLLQDLGLRMGLLLLPLFGTLMVAAIALNVMQSGLNVSSKALMPKGDRISPMAGFKRVFSGQSVMTLVKALLKIVIVAPIAYLNIKKHLPEILMLHTHALPSILATTMSWISTMLFQMILAISVLSAADYAYGKHKYKKKLKMSFQEVKDEAKESDGNPELKGKRKQRARELSRRARIDHAVLKADVVVTNPTHYAVALRYDPTEADAPRVLCKGIRKRALQIKAFALEHGIPTVEDRPLARALYASAEEEQTIPEELFPAVAALLAEIYKQKGKRV